MKPLLFSLVALTLGLAPLQADSSRPTNVVLFLVDDLGWMDLACQGSDFYQMLGLLFQSRL